MYTKGNFKDLLMTVLTSAFWVFAIVIFVSDYLSSLYLRGEESSFILLAMKIAAAFSLLIYCIVRIGKRKQDLLKKEAELLFQSEQRCRMLEEFSDNVRFDVKLSENTIDFNSNFECVFGQMPGISRLSDWRNLLSFIALDDLQVVISAWKRVTEQCEQTSDDIRIIDAEGQMVWHRLSLIAQYDSNGDAFRVLGKLANIDAQVRQSKRMRLKSMQDPLTRLYQMKSSQELVDDYLKGEGLNGNHAMLLIDIDNLKELNESLGRRAGDSVLQLFSKDMKRIFRTTDIIGRLSGDEFMVFLKDIPSARILEFKVREFLKDVSNLKIENNALPIICSIGAAFYAKDGITFSELYKSAEAALYQTKFSGKSNYTLCTVAEQSLVCETC